MRTTSENSASGGLGAQEAHLCGHIWLWTPAGMSCGKVRTAPDAPDLLTAPSRTLHIWFLVSPSQERGRHQLTWAARANLPRPHGVAFCLSVPPARPHVDTLSSTQLQIVGKYLMS